MKIKVRNLRRIIKEELNDLDIQRDDVNGSMYIDMDLNPEELPDDETLLGDDETDMIDPEGTPRSAKDISGLDDEYHADIGTSRSSGASLDAMSATPRSAKAVSDLDAAYQKRTKNL